MRHELPVIAHGDCTMLLEDDEDIYADVRSLDTTQLLIVANLSDHARLVDGLDPGWEGAELLLSNCAGPNLWSQPLLLAAWEARLSGRS